MMDIVRNVMGIKSRGNWSVGVCFKKCSNRDIKCDECISFSHLKKLPYKHKSSDCCSVTNNVQLDRSEANGKS